MKKVILNLIIAIAAMTVHGQTYFINEDFESASLPAGWSRTSQAYDSGWNVGSNIQNPVLHASPHTNYAMTNDWGSSNNHYDERLITPLMDLSLINRVFLSFDYYFIEGYDNTYHVYETFKLMYSINGGTTWNALDTLHATNGWQTEYIDVSNELQFQSNIKLCFYYSDGYGNFFGAAIDNVKLFSPDSIAAALTSISPDTNFYNSTVGMGHSINISGKIRNLGINTIQGITIKYFDGSAVESFYYTDSIQSLGEGSFVHQIGRAHV